MNKILKYIKHPSRILLSLASRNLLIMSDKIYLKKRYRIRTNKKLNLNDPKTFNEKLQWLKLYDRNPEYTKMVDKYEVKEYVAKIIGKEYIIPTLGVWDKFDDIDFDKLPNQFVLKCTHDSGGLIICKDKSIFDMHSAKRKINKCLKRNYYYAGREWPYKNVKPRIIAEKYMADESGNELKDYKIFNFNGKSKLIQVDYGRFTNHKRNFYDINWNYLEDFSLEFPNDSKVVIKKPNNLANMLNLAEKLSKNFPHLRTDFYSINDSIYFGELTFYHGSGCEKFNPEKWDEVLGSWLELPKEKSEEKNEK